MENKEMLKYKIFEIIYIGIYSVILWFIMMFIASDNFVVTGLVLKHIITNNGFQYITVSILIILANLLIFKGIFNNSFKANLIVTIFGMIIATISYYKINRLSEPFIPSDILLIGNAKEIATYGLTLPSMMIVLSILLLSIVFILHYSIDKKIKIYKENNKKLKIKNMIARIIMFTIGVLLLLFMCINPNRFEQLDIKNSLGDDYNWMGAHAVFFMHLGDFYTKAPENYTKENIEAIREENEINSIEQKQNPNVIFIMNESFFDPNGISIVEYSKDPIGDIKELSQNSENCKIGDIITPVAFGGTSLPEFEALTGMSSYYITKQTYPYTSYIRSNMNSIVRTFKENNYDTIGIHTYKGGFYNRKSVYNYLGFNQSIFEEDMVEPEYKATYISDNELSNQIITEYQSSSSKNKFIFGVSMQNHIPYANKQYEKYDIDVVSSKLSTYEIEELKKCVQGIYDANKMYVKLAEYINTVEENTVLIMFGDHLPYLKDYNAYKRSMYNKEGYYTTPYIVYTNYDIKLDDIPNVMSPCNLGINVLKTANINLPWYLEEFNKLYKEYPVFTNQYIMDKNGQVYNAESFKVNNELIDRCRILEYDLLIKKKYIEIRK